MNPRPSTIPGTLVPKSDYSVVTRISQHGGDCVPIKIQVRPDLYDTGTVNALFKEPVLVYVLRLTYAELYWEHSKYGHAEPDTTYVFRGRTIHGLANLIRLQPRPGVNLVGVEHDGDFRIFVQRESELFKFSTMCARCLHCDEARVDHTTDERCLYDVTSYTPKNKDKDGDN